MGLPNTNRSARGCCLLSMVERPSLMEQMGVREALYMR